MAIDTVQVEAKKATDKAGKIRLLTLDDLDGRTRARQRAEELREHLISERGGAGQIDIMRMAHIDTWTVMTAIIEDQLTRYMRGDPTVEMTSVATQVNARRREGEVIGEPEPRDVTPSLGEYLAAAIDQDSE
jgi:hypothetical protein